MSKPSQKILLSVCLIVKNEEEKIALCLKSIKPVADEIIVNDTGSTDDTVKISQDLGAKVIHSEWRDDFSYSRNLSIEQAQGKWILWLDADDYVPENSLKLIDEVKRKKPDRVFNIICSNLRPDGTGTSFRQARIFPNNKGIVFERPIHEQMMISALKLGLKLYDTDIVVEHRGYNDSETQKKKARRNCKLLTLQYDKGQRDPVTILEIGDSYLIMGESEKAEKWYYKFLQNDVFKKKCPDLASQVLLGLGQILSDREEYEKSEKYLREGLELIPQRIDLRYMLAANLYLQKRIEESYEELEIILSSKNETLIVAIDHESARRKSYKKMVLIQKDFKNSEKLSCLAEDIIDRYGKNSDMLNSAGRAYYYSGRLLDSLKTFQQSLTIQQEGNFEAFAGLITIYMVAGKRDAALTTVTNIKEYYKKFPAFAALCTIHSLLDSSVFEISEDDLAKEIEYMKEIFPI